MQNTIEQIKILLDERIRPLVADRGGDLTFQSLTDGLLRLSLTGSPGAAVPIKSNISDLIRHYVAAVSAVEFSVGTAGLSRQTVTAAEASAADAVQRVLDDLINPAVHAHGGFIRLVEVRTGEAFIRFEQACQGCAMAHVTLRQGVEVIIREHVAEIYSVVDVTDHENGTSPYFKTKKT